MKIPGRTCSGPEKKVIFPAHRPFLVFHHAGPHFGPLLAGPDPQENFGGQLENFLLLRKICTVKMKKAKQKMQKHKRKTGKSDLSLENK